MELTPKQEEAVRISVERFKTREPYTCISGYAGSGKAQPLDTIIPTPNGYRKLGELKIGDYVFDRKGLPTKILGVYPQGELEVYTIKLKDGRETKCGKEHLWSVIDKHGRTQEKTTEQLIKSGLKNSAGYKYAVPNNLAIQYPEKDYAVDPYVIGTFLGDGCCLERQLTISSETEEIPNIIASLIGSNKVIKQSGKNYNWTFLLNDSNDSKKIKFQTKEYFKDFLKEICVHSQEKRIPDVYKTGSIQQRLNLIQGLMDTDGSIGKNDEKRYNVRFTSVSYALILDLQEVLHSLGYNSTISIDKRTDKYTSCVCYSLNINIPNEEKYKLFRLKRKYDTALEAQQWHKYKDYSKISIIDIIPENYKTNMVCIYVDNDEHLYITNDYIVTHNTTTVSAIVDALGVDPVKDVAYVAYTGKAATVLKQKGCANAITAHKLIYKAEPMPDGNYIFIPKDKLDDDYKVIIVDEVSMLPKEMWDLLLTYKVYVIACGDPGQLPPIDPKTDNHVLDRPHVFLDQIMRQAAESEIIRLSMHVREGLPLYQFQCENKEVQIIRKPDIVDGMYNWADQILCAKNLTRKNINDAIRKMKGYPDEPVIGDKVISLRNHWDVFSMNNSPLTNGAIGTLTKFIKSDRKVPYWICNKSLPVLRASIQTDYDEVFNGLEIDYTYLHEGRKILSPQQEYKLAKAPVRFGGGCPPLEFDYAYSITTHKAQGSEWNNVMVIEENFPFEKEEHKRWLYTAITRSSKRLLLVRM